MIKSTRLPSSLLFPRVEGEPGDEAIHPTCMIVCGCVYVYILCVCVHVHVSMHVYDHVRECVIALLDLATMVLQASMELYVHSRLFFIHILE